MIRTMHEVTETMFPSGLIVHTVPTALWLVAVAFTFSHLNAPPFLLKFSWYTNQCRGRYDRRGNHSTQISAPVGQKLDSSNFLCPGRSPFSCSSRSNNTDSLWAYLGHKQFYSKYSPPIKELCPYQGIKKERLPIPVQRDK